VANSRNSNVTAAQVLVAAILGIGIGLGVSYNFDHQGLRTKITPAVKASLNRLSKSNFKLAEAVSPFPKLQNRTNILLMGVDSNGKKAKRFLNTRSDTMILASIDPETKKVGLISIPRDSRVRIFERKGLDKINSAHALGGPETARKTVEQFLGIPIDHYVVIDTQGLKSVCEIVGPIEVLVEKRMRYRDRASGLNINLEPGLQKLTAAQVEEYCRFRHDQKGDLGRIERQQWFLRQAAHKFKEPSVVLKLPEIIKFANEYVVTDLSLNDMMTLFGFAKDLKESQIETAMLPGEARMIKGGSYYVPDPEGVALVLQRMTGTTPSVSIIAANTSSEHDVQEATFDGEDNYDLSSDSAQSPSNDTLQTAWANSCADTRPLRLVIRYPMGQEQTAKDFAETLTEAGYDVISRVRCKSSECAHQQIMLNSFRADQNMTNSLKSRFPELTEFPIVLNPLTKTRIDATIQISPDTIPLMPHETAGQFDYDVSDINGEVKASKFQKSKLPNS
jgi:polyisoprenyl-teichoic acid--peptidoglycan teichoic acid transferase